MSVSSNSYTPRIQSKGSLIVHTGTSTAELAVGQEGYVLSAQSSATTGLFWSAPLDTVVDQILISSATSTADFSSVSFTSIPSTFKHLLIEAVPRATSGTGMGDLHININSDSTSNAYGYASWRYTDSDNNSDVAPLVRDTKYIAKGTIAQGTTTKHYPKTFILIPNYSNSSYTKSLYVNSHAQAVSTGSNVSTRQVFSTGFWLNSSAITSIDLVNGAATSFVGGKSYFKLYGLY